VKDLDRYLRRMSAFEKLLRRHTWLTEGSTAETFRNPGTLGEGWLQRYGIDAAVHELNCHWNCRLEGLPRSRHWECYGGQLARVFYEYFNMRRPEGER
jgi:hypothetical protein